MANCRLVNTSYLLVSGLRPISRKKNSAFQASLNALFFFLAAVLEVLKLLQKSDIVFV